MVSPEPAPRSGTSSAEPRARARVSEMRGASKGGCGARASYAAARVSNYAVSLRVWSESAWPSCLIDRFIDRCTRFCRELRPLLRRRPCSSLVRPRLPARAAETNANAASRVFFPPLRRGQRTVIPSLLGLVSSAQFGRWSVHTYSHGPWLSRRLSIELARDRLETTLTHQRESQIAPGNAPRRLGS